MEIRSTGSASEDRRRMTALGQTETSERIRSMSALALNSGHPPPLQLLPSRATSGLHAAQQTARHSMSWSARRRKDSEIVSPRVLAVFKLMTSANLVGCWMGRSEGLAPFKILST
jgi:predicted ATPase